MSQAVERVQRRKDEPFFPVDVYVCACLILQLE